MGDSKFRKIIENDIKESGYGVLLTPSYSSLVAKTVITKHSESKASFTWLDADGDILTQCPEVDLNDSSIPRVGKIGYEHWKAQYQRDYTKKKTTSFHMKLTHHDQDIIDFLSAQPNVQGLLKRLIREEMARISVSSENTKQQ